MTSLLKIHRRRPWCALVGIVWALWIGLHGGVCHADDAAPTQACSHPVEQRAWPVPAHVGAVPPQTGHVTDTTGVLSEACRLDLTQRLGALERDTGAQIAVLLVATTAQEPIDAYAVRVFEQWKPGRKHVDDGVLLVAALNDRRVRIEVGYGLEATIPDVAAAAVIRDEIAPEFRSGAYEKGLSDAISALAARIEHRLAVDDANEAATPKPDENLINAYTLAGEPAEHTSATQPREASWRLWSTLAFANAALGVVLAALARRAPPRPAKRLTRAQRKQRRHARRFGAPSSGSVNSVPLARRIAWPIVMLLGSALLTATLYAAATAADLSGDDVRAWATTWMLVGVPALALAAAVTRCVGAIGGVLFAAPTLALLVFLGVTFGATTLVFGLLWIAAAAMIRAKNIPAEDRPKRRSPTDDGSWSDSAGSRSSWDSGSSSSGGGSSGGGGASGSW